MRSKILSTAFLIAIGTVAPLILIEIGFRILSPLLQKQVWNDRPNVYYLNERSGGNRDYYYPLEKDPGHYRIVVVGDSFTYGFGNLFDDSFVKRLERIMNSNANQPQVEVLNFGVPGYSTQMEIRLVKEALMKYHPDLIILEITLNDPEIKPTAIGHESMKDRMGSFVAQGGIYDYWRSLGWIVARIRNARSYTEYKEYFQKLFKDRDTLQNFRLSLREIAFKCKESRTPLVAMVFPLLSFPMDDTYPFFEAHQTTHELLDQFHVPYLDLFESFRGIPPDRLQARPGIDPHPNEIAHRIAAESLYRWLRKNKIIPKEVLVKVVSRKRIGPAPSPHFKIGKTRAPRPHAHKRKAR